MCIENQSVPIKQRSDWKSKSLCWKPRKVENTDNRLLDIKNRRKWRFLLYKNSLFKKLALTSLTNPLKNKTASFKEAVVFFCEVYPSNQESISLPKSLSTPNSSAMERTVMGRIVTRPTRKHAAISIRAAAMSTKSTTP